MRPTVAVAPDNRATHRERMRPETLRADRFRIMARPHYASRLEDRWNTALQAVLRRRGWRDRVIPHVGYGTQDFVRVLARVVLSRDPRDLPRYEEDQPVRGWRQFVAAPSVGVPVTVTVGEQTQGTTTDRGGFVDVTVPASLPPGWHEVELGVADDRSARARVHVVDPHANFGIVSDIDDTVMLTMLPRPMIAAWNTFVRDEQARRVVPGMAEMYRALLAEQARRTPAGSAAAASTSRPRWSGWPPSSRRCAGCWSATTVSTTRRSTATSPAPIPATSARSRSAS